MAHPHPHDHSDLEHDHPHHHDAISHRDYERVPYPDVTRQEAPEDRAGIAYLDCFAGASGDMLLGALVDAGLPLDTLQEELAKLDLEGYALEAERKEDHGITGTKLHVHDTLQAYPARHLADIRRIVDHSGLSDWAKAQSMGVIESLGRAEAKIHSLPLEQVHFHEVGAVDTIVDIVGFVVGLELLGIGQVYASAIPLGSGSVQTAHGRLPVPAPATLELLTSVSAPTVPHPAQTEIVTPTGAALLAHLASFERPAMRIRSVGYGLGSKAFPWTNGLRVWLGERIEAHDFQHDQVVEMHCNLDDVTGEVLGYTMERLFAAGALDVWFTSIQMKKNRPGVLLSVLSPLDRVDSLSRILMQETSTLGVRTFPPAHRMKADRRFREVETPWGKVRVKEKWIEGRLLAASPEYEDCARLSRESEVPIARIMNVARQIAEQ
jgi:uncharacterized protein (TIGR00299 family) protein